MQCGQCGFENPSGMKFWARDAVREYAGEVRTRYGVPFGVRLGLNSGDVVVGRIGDDLRMDYTAQGLTVGLAQRMESLAESGHIVLSEHTARLVEGYFRLHDLGRTKVQGVGEPIGVFELESASKLRTRLEVAQARGLTRFVSRDAEMNVLEMALARARGGPAAVRRDGRYRAGGAAREGPGSGRPLRTSRSCPSLVPEARVSYVHRPCP